MRRSTESVKMNRPSGIEVPGFGPGSRFASGLRASWSGERSMTLGWHLSSSYRRSVFLRSGGGGAPIGGGVSRRYQAPPTRHVVGQGIRDRHRLDLVHRHASHSPALGVAGEPHVVGEMEAAGGHLYDPGFGVGSRGSRFFLALLPCGGFGRALPGHPLGLLVCAGLALGVQRFGTARAFWRRAAKLSTRRCSSPAPWATRKSASVLAIMPTPPHSHWKAMCSAHKRATARALPSPSRVACSHSAIRMRGSAGGCPSIALILSYSGRRSSPSTKRHAKRGPGGPPEPAPPGSPPAA
jgi:hypothetical protein